MRDTSHLSEQPGVMTMSALRAGLHQCSCMWHVFSIIGGMPRATAVSKFKIVAVVLQAAAAQRRNIAMCCCFSSFVSRPGVQAHSAMPLANQWANCPLVTTARPLALEHP